MATVPTPVPCHYSGSTDPLEHVGSCAYIYHPVDSSSHSNSAMGASIHAHLRAITEELGPE